MRTGHSITLLTASRKMEWRWDVAEFNLANTNTLSVAVCGGS